MGTAMASFPVPPFPRVTYSSASGASRLSFQRVACSRPPLPTSSIFIARSSLAECLFEILQQIVAILHPAGEPEQAVGDSHRLSALRRPGCVRHQRRVSDEAPHPPEGFREREDA